MVDISAGAQIGLGGVSAGIDAGFGPGGFNIGAQASFSGLGFSVGIGSSDGPIAGQTFRNIPVPNFRPAVYQLSIRAPQPPHTAITSYTFPLSPESLRKEITAMTTIHDVAGSAAQGGVQRIVDQYGNAPAVFTLEGTTGWQYHGTDGYQQTGIQSILMLEQLLAQFAQLNQLQVEQQQLDLYTLELYDYFMGDYWQVVPVGPQGRSQNRRQPLLARYLFRFFGVKDLGAPPAAPPSDTIAQAFSQSAAQAADSLINFDLSLTASYGPVTLQVQV